MESQGLTSAVVIESEDDLTRPMQFTALSNKPTIWSKYRGLSKSAKLRLKVLVSILLFASLFVFGKIDLAKSFEVASKANPALLAAAALIFVGSTLVNAYRWHALAAAVGLEKPVWQLLQYCFVGFFFNLFLPSTVGGDVSRCYYLSKGTGKYKQAFYSVLADRAVGIAILFLFASCGILFGPGASGLPWHLKLPILLGTFAVLVGVPLTPDLVPAGAW